MIRAAVPFAILEVAGTLACKFGLIPAATNEAQIIAWAAIFGYSQQLFTRLVDQQAHAVLNSVRGGGAAHQTARSD